MSLFVYVDESSDDHAYAVVGVVAEVEDWTLFCSSWQEILNRNQVPYFHFLEWQAGSAFARKGKDSTDAALYKHLNVEQLDQMLVDLALVFKLGKFVFFGPVKNLHEFKKITGRSRFKQGDYEWLMECFFKEYWLSLSDKKPEWRGKKVSIIFDQMGKGPWKKAILKMYNRFAMERPELNGIAFKNDKDCPPIQGIDLAAYRFRQMASDHPNGDFVYPTWPRLDAVLRRFIFEGCQWKNNDGL